MGADTLAQGATKGIHDVVTNYLRQFSGTRLSYYAGGGNAGDSLIATGAYTCFDRLNIKIDPINLSEDGRPGVVVFAGGGNFIPLYDYIRKGIIKQRPTADQIVVLPHTIRGNEDLLAALDNRVTLFCCDIQSYEHCLRHARRADVRLAHDMAFHADVEALLADPVNCETFRRDYDDTIKRFPRFVEKILRGEPINFMRDDAEKAQRAIPTDMDVSEVFMGSLSDRASVKRSTWSFLSAIKSANSIVTDRLHVAIAASLLNIPCEILDNSYGKNRAIYEFSLAGRFEKTSFRFEDLALRRSHRTRSLGKYSPTVALGYCMTKQSHIIARMQGVITAQAEVDRRVGTNLRYRRILITDASYEEIPGQFFDFFDDFRFGVDAFYFDYLVQKSYFSLSQLRNAAFSYATQENFDWLLLCDCDTIFANYDFTFPAGGYGVPEVYWQKSADESVLESLEAVGTPGPDTFSKGNSWFLLSRAIFSESRFNENIYGYGYEDREFDLRVRSGGRVLESTDLRIIHRFHPSTEREVDIYVDGRNRTIFEYTLDLSQHGSLRPNGEQFGTFYAKHANWQGFLILFFSRGRLLSLEQGSAANFRIEGRTLTVYWDRFGPETFIFEDGAFMLS